MSNISTIPAGRWQKGKNARFPSTHTPVLEPMRVPPAQFHEFESSIGVKIGSENTRTIVVNGNSMLPLYRHGDMLIVAEAGSIKVGDRAIIQTQDDKTLGGTIIQRTDKVVALRLSGLMREDVLVYTTQIKFLGRILWASQ